MWASVRIAICAVGVSQAGRCVLPSPPQTLGTGIKKRKHFHTNISVVYARQVWRCFLYGSKEEQGRRAERAD